MATTTPAQLLEWQGRWGTWAPGGVRVYAPCVAAFEVTLRDVDLSSEEAEGLFRQALQEFAARLAEVEEQCKIPAMKPGAVADIAASFPNFSSTPSANSENNDDDSSNSGKPSAAKGSQDLSGPALVASIRWTGQRPLGPPTEPRAIRRGLQAYFIGQRWAAQRLCWPWRKRQAVCDGRAAILWLCSFDTASPTHAKEVDQLMSAILPTEQTTVALTFDIPSSWMRDEDSSLVGSVAALPSTSEWFRFCRTFGNPTSVEVIWRSAKGDPEEERASADPKLLVRFKTATELRAMAESLMFRMLVAPWGSENPCWPLNCALLEYSQLRQRLVEGWLAQDDEVIFGLHRCGGTAATMPSEIMLTARLPSLVVGREDPADVVLPMALVSKNHAMLRVHGRRRLTIKDTSVNGIWVNNAKIAKEELCQLKLGDKVSFLPPGRQSKGEILIYEVMAYPWQSTLPCWSNAKPAASKAEDNIEGSSRPKLSTVRSATIDLDLDDDSGHEEVVVEEAKGERQKLGSVGGTAASTTTSTAASTTASSESRTNSSKRQNPAIRSRRAGNEDEEVAVVLDDDSDSPLREFSKGSIDELREALAGGGGKKRRRSTSPRPRHPPARTPRVAAPKKSVSAAVFRGPSLEQKELREWLLLADNGCLSSYESKLMSLFDSVDEIRQQYGTNVAAFTADLGVTKPEHKISFRRALLRLRKNAPS